jgi:Dehydrogenases with different specificities (related to short-chain alcohol dehydrogenases)
MKLEHKVAVVTGGASGIGLAIAQAFAAEGAKLALFDLNKDALEKATSDLRAQGTKAISCVVNITASAEVRKGFQSVLDTFGTIDILVNSAGIIRMDDAGVKDRVKHLDMLTTPGPKTSLRVTSQMSDEEWLRNLDVNLNGTFYCMREALRTMEEKGSGKIINMASQAGISAIAAHSPHYTAAKAAIVGLTKSVAHEVAPAGIAVNCIAPGYVTSPPFQRGVEKMGEERLARMMQIIPAGRFARPEEIGAIAAFLASDDASYMIGQVVSPNGGVVI